MRPVSAGPAPAPVKQVSSRESGVPSFDAVRQAVARVYGDAVVIEDPAAGGFVAGDFNSDGSEDLAVVVRPAHKRLALINDDLANWTIQDAQRVELPPTNERVLRLPLKPRLVKAGPREVLLAVIHGYGASGWRSPQARQAYLLEHAVGEHLRSVSFRSLRLRALAAAPPVTGEVVLETICGVDGFIYWTGAQYAWRMN